MTHALRVLGPWRLAAPDGQLCRVRLPVQRLLAFLVLNGRMQQRVLVAGTLWPDNCDQRANANLRSALWHARSEVPGLVDGDGSTIWVSAALVVDVDRAVVAIRLALAGVPLTVADRALLGEDVLPSWDEDWLPAVRYRHRQLRLLALARADEDAAVTTAPQPCATVPRRDGP